MFNKKSYEVFDELKEMVKIIKDYDLLNDQYNHNLDMGVIRSLWTAFCFHNGWEPDHADYDTTLEEIYQDIIANRKYAWKNFKSFDNYMCKYLV